MSNEQSSSETRACSECRKRERDDGIVSYLALLALFFVFGFIVGSMP